MIPAPHFAVAPILTVYCPNPRILARIFLNDVSRPIFGTVVDQHIFSWKDRLLNDALDRKPQVGFLVPNRSDNNVSRLTNVHCDAISSFLMYVELSKLGSASETAFEGLGRPKNKLCRCRSDQFF